MKKKDKAVERMNERKNSTDSALKCTDAAHSFICSPADEAEQNIPSCWKPLATADNEEKEKEEGGQMCQEREKKKERDEDQTKGGAYLPVTHNIFGDGKEAGRQERKQPWPSLFLNLAVPM